MYTQAPLHIVRVLTHWRPQATPSHVADPPSTPGHAVHLSPHDEVEVLLTQRPLHECEPLAHVHWPRAQL
jgi:hypothetical protein